MIRSIRASSLRALAAAPRHTPKNTLAVGARRLSTALDESSLRLEPQLERVIYDFESSRRTGASQEQGEAVPPRKRSSFRQ